MIPWENCAEEPRAADVVVVADLLEHTATTIGKTFWVHSAIGRCEGVAAVLREIGPMRVDLETLRRMMSTARLPVSDVIEAAQRRESPFKGEAWGAEWVEGLALFQALAAEDIDADEV